jgi:hypothetical protein
MKYLLEYGYVGRPRTAEEFSGEQNLFSRRVLVIFGQVIGSGKRKYAFVAVNEEH